MSWSVSPSPTVKRFVYHGLSILLVSGAGFAWIWGLLGGFVRLDEYLSCHIR